jgi:hypothetical protein
MKRSRRVYTSKMDVKQKQKEARIGLLSLSQAVGE